MAKLVQKELQNKKKKGIVNDSDSENNQKIIDFYGKHKTVIDRFSRFLKQSKSQYDISSKDILLLLENKKAFSFVPISIFKNDLSPLEAVVQYLKEVGYSFKEISVIVKRSNKTIWTTYNNAIKKEVTLNTDSEIVVPLAIIANRNLSTLENVCLYLKEEFSFSLSKISRLLDRNKNTIWTTYKRTQEKIKNVS